MDHVAHIGIAQSRGGRKQKVSGAVVDDLGPNGCPKLPSFVSVVGAILLVLMYI